MAGNDMNLAVRISLNQDGAITGFRQLAAAGTNAGRQMASGMQSISNQLAAVRSQVLGLGQAYLGLHGIQVAAEMADDWARLGGMMDVATKGAVQQVAAQQAVFELAQRTRGSLVDTGNLVAVLTQNFEGLGQSGTAAFANSLKLTETINQSIVVSNSSAAAASGAMLQFQQLMNSGIVRAQEFNSVNEGAHRLVQAAADGLHMSVAELRKAGPGCWPCICSHPARPTCRRWSSSAIWGCAIAPPGSSSTRSCRP